jgi:hypothetical protein
MRQSIVTVAVCAAVLCGDTARARGQCVGDCSGSGAVAINDLITMVNIALGSSDVATCGAGDANGDGEITINEIIAAVNNALTGCPPEATNTPVETATPTSTPPPTQTATGSPASTGTATATSTPTPTPTQTATPTLSTSHDNGDGTITDTNTGLMWEKKDDAGGIHDQDKLYTWSTTGTAGDGTAFTDFLATLNRPPCFTGHCDWRLPSIQQLESIFDASVTDCGPSPSPPCVDTAFNTSCQTGCTVDGSGDTRACSCTQSDVYWSAAFAVAETAAPSPESAAKCPRPFTAR